MATLLNILLIVAWIANLILFIMVLIKLFQAKGVLHGILGLICGLYTFIWGWMNSAMVGKNIMIGWTVAIVVQLILAGATGAMTSASGF